MEVEEEEEWAASLQCSHESWARKQTERSCKLKMLFAPSTERKVSTDEDKTEEVVERTRCICHFFIVCMRTMGQCTLLSMHKHILQF